MTVELTRFPVTTTEPCVLHKWCIKKSIANELHHVVPQAWQKFWRPTGTSAAVIWDDRKIPCDPLGHRNVHHILVAAMHAYEDHVWDEGEEETEGMAEEAQQLAVKKLRAEGHHVTPKEAFWALEGMWRWLQQGGSLIELCLAGLYGEA